MKSRLAALVLLLGPVATAVAAGTLSCPDPGAAVQVGTCPSEEQLKYGFTGYCSDNARMYDKSSVDCSDEKAYRKLKNVALWESAGGAFQGYLSCDLPAAAVKAAKASAIAVAKQGGVTRVVCTYPEGIAFTYRTRSACRVQGDGSCASNPSLCTASCD